jgi:sugar phosphate isomerase/epimerase
MEAVLRRIADIGYVGVEPAGFGDLTAKDFRRVLDDTGLTLSSAHTALPVGSSTNEVLDDMETIGATMLIASGRPDEFASLESVEKCADKFNAAAANAAGRGMAIGYHNHFWEFEGTVDGQVPYEALHARLDPSIVAEVDIYWATVGGKDPADVIRGLGSKARYLHVKDGPVEPKMPMTAVGQGKVDIEGALAAANDAQWHIVELDECATDMFTALEDSHRYLVGRGLSAGR